VIDLAAPQGFEPRYADPESAVLAVERGGSNAPCRYSGAIFILWFNMNNGQHNLLLKTLVTRHEAIANQDFPSRLAIKFL
jgi:hypothetical protein